MRTKIQWKPNLSAEKRLARKQFLSERSCKGVAARARLREERTKDEPIRQDIAGLLLYTLTVHNRRTGKITGKTITLAVVLQSVQTTTGQITATIPAGYYARLRSVNVAGNPTFSYLAGQEVLLP